MGEMIETYRGEALAWEADELGHMNMRYYFARAAQARANFAQSLRLSGIYKQNALSTLIPTRQHIKYHKEIRPGQGLFAKTGILKINQTEMELVHVISRVAGADDAGTLAATIVETLSHISNRTQNPFGWPKRMLALARKFTVTLPDAAAPRNLDPGEALGLPGMAAADKLGLPVIGRGVFMPSECDIFGYVLPSAIIGRVSDSVQHLTTAWPDLDFTSNDRVSGALLEAMARHKNRPKAGDLFVMRSGLRSANTHTRELCHWILDPVSGKCWSTFTGVGCRFDLKTRRLVKIDDKTLTLIRSGIVKNLMP